MDHRCDPWQGQTKTAQNALDFQVMVPVPGILLVIVVENVVLPKFFRNFLDREDEICETSKVCSLKLKL